MRKLGIGSALALMGVIALVAGGIAVATSGDDTTVRQVDEEGGAGGDGRDREGPGFHWRMEGPSAKEIRERREEFAKALGEELDKPTAEVLEALRNVFRKRLDKAVEDGHLTRREADRIIECHESANCEPPEFRRGDGPDFRGDGPDFRGGPPPGLRGGPPPGFGGPPPGFAHPGGPPGF